jgi:NAD(P)-dependent dehydrogenase (short-subunit alcohol dehydrogenase family)
VDLDGKAAIVTGGAGGLGSAVVRHLSGIGTRVVVFDWDTERARAVAEEIGGSAVGVSGDVNDDDAEHIRLDGALRFAPK